MPQESKLLTQQTNALQQVADEYESHPAVRALIQLILAPLPFGIGNAIDDALTSAIQNIRANRARVFFDELVKGSVNLTEEVITHSDFLHAYFATTKAALNTRHEEKIRLFARLLTNGVSMQLAGSEQFDEFLAILDDLSIVELRILLILHHHEQGDGIMKTSRAGYWAAFEKEVKTKCALESDALRAKLARLNRTGLYETDTGSYYNYGGGQGSLTAVFPEFIRWVEVSEDELMRESLKKSD